MSDGALTRAYGGLVEDELVSRLCGGDDEAFSEIHHRFSAQLTVLARRILRDRTHDAEDVGQDAFIRASSDCARPTVRSHCGRGYTRSCATARSTSCAPGETSTWSRRRGQCGRCFHSRTSHRDPSAVAGQDDRPGRHLRRPVRQARGERAVVEAEEFERDDPALAGEMLITTRRSDGDESASSSRCTMDCQAASRPRQRAGLAGVTRETRGSRGRVRLRAAEFVSERGRVMTGDVGTMRVARRSSACGRRAASRP